MQRILRNRSFCLFEDTFYSSFFGGLSAPSSKAIPEIFREKEGSVVWNEIACPVTQI